VACLLALSCQGAPRVLHVVPGDDLQAALDRAAEQGIRRVLVAPGTYRPPGPRQALIRFNARHDGLVVEADGAVTLTAAAPARADSSSPAFPAIVNHVVYFGDGVGPSTVLRGFTIEGANGFETREPPEIEGPLPDIPRTDFFYSDGGAVKIFGRSYPTLERLRIVDNYSTPCGAGVSVEHRGHDDRAVTIRDCVFRRNRVPLTGAAIDLLGEDRGSYAVIENCLFEGNLANEPHDRGSRRLGTWKPRSGHGAITVFRASRADVRRCTFVGNRNGVDDESPRSVYARNLFWRNDAPGGWARGPRYELDCPRAVVEECRIGGSVPDDQRSRLAARNELDIPDPRFDDAFVPADPACEGVGYRPPR